MTSGMRVLRAALERDVLRFDGVAWRFGTYRRFSFEIVARLIATGEAERVGDIVRRRAA
jgi:hypothetical protein